MTYVIEGSNVTLSLSADEMNEVIQSLEQTSDNSELLEAWYEFRKEEFAWYPQGSPIPCPWNYLMKTKWFLVSAIGMSTATFQRERDRKEKALRKRLKRKEAARQRQLRKLVRVSVHMTGEKGFTTTVDKDVAWTWWQLLRVVRCHQQPFCPSLWRVEDSSPKISTEFCSVLRGRIFRVLLDCPKEVAATWNRPFSTLRFLGNL